MSPSPDVAGGDGVAVPGGRGHNRRITLPNFTRSRQDDLVLCELANQPFELGTPRPTGAGVGKAELAVRRELRARVRGMRRGPPHCEPQRAMFPPDPLPSGNPSGYNAVRRADHAAGASGYAEERGLGSAACVTWHGMACRPKEERAWTMPAAAPPPPPRRTRRACWYLVARRFPAPIRADSVCGPSASLWEAQRYPWLFVTVWSAPPTSSATADLVQPCHAAWCSAVDLPDGAGAIGTVGDRRGRRSGRGEGRTRRGCSWCSGRRARR